MERRMFKMYCEEFNNKFVLGFKMNDVELNNKVEDSFEEMLKNSSEFFNNCCEMVGFDGRFDRLEVDLFYNKKNEKDVCNEERKDCNGNRISMKRKFKVYCFEDSYFEFSLILVMDGRMVEKITCNCFEDVLYNYENISRELDRKYCYNKKYDELGVELNYIYC